MINIKKKIIEIITLIIGIIICALSFNIFLLPTKIVSGFSGISIIVNNVFDIKPSIFLMISYIFVLILSFIVLGKNHTKNSIIGSILYPIFVELTSYITPYIDLGDTEHIVLAICGGALSGLGFGMVYKLGYNTGGSDILTQILGKWFKKPIGTCMVIVNAIIITLAFFTFGFQTALYSIITILVMSYIVDKVMLGISASKSIYVITESETKVKEYLIQKLSHGVTVIDARGGYTGNVIKLIMCIVPTREYYRVKEGILQIDENALILISDTYEVVGNK